VEDKVEHSSENNFKKIVKKEPAKYFAKHPLRGVARLGSKQYGLVVDQKDEKSKTYDRLYFDLNGNGDLTDDTPIDVADDQKDAAGRNVSSQFPRVDLTIDVDGKKLDYSFFFNAGSQHWGKNHWISASLSPAVYGRGEITLDGQSRKIAVLDFNSNGRFDDRITLPKNIHDEEGGLYPQFGDVLLIDPQKVSPSDFQRYYESNEHRKFLSKLLNIAGKYYEVKVSPVGDRLTWTPSVVSFGKISSPHAPCSMTLMGENGFLSLKLEKSEPAEVPAGQWRLLSYELQVKDWKKP